MAKTAIVQRGESCWRERGSRTCPCGIDVERAELLMSRGCRPNGESGGAGTEWMPSTGENGPYEEWGQLAG